MIEITTKAGALISDPIWVDFMHEDWDGNLPLEFPGTLRDLANAGVVLREGIQLVLYEEDADDLGRVDDLIALATVQFDHGEGRWVASGWEPTFHCSDLDSPQQEVYKAARAAQRDRRRRDS
jgi:hypothetical protein